MTKTGPKEAAQRALPRGGIAPRTTPDAAGTPPPAPLEVRDAAPEADPQSVTPTRSRGVTDDTWAVGAVAYPEAVTPNVAYREVATVPPAGTAVVPRPASRAGRARAASRARKRADAAGERLIVDAQDG